MAHTAYKILDLITFLTAGDPDMASFEAVLEGLPAAQVPLARAGVNRA